MLGWQPAVQVVLLKGDGSLCSPSASPAGLLNAPSLLLSQAADPQAACLLPGAAWVFLAVSMDCRVSPGGFLLANYMLMCGAWTAWV